MGGTEMAAASRARKTVAASSRLVTVLVITGIAICDSASVGQALGTEMFAASRARKTVAASSRLVTVLVITGIAIRDSASVGQALGTEMVAASPDNEVDNFFEKAAT